MECNLSKWKPRGGIWDERQNSSTTIVDEGAVVDHLDFKHVEYVNVGLGISSKSDRSDIIGRSESTRHNRLIHNGSRNKHFDSRVRHGQQITPNKSNH